MNFKLTINQGQPPLFETNPGEMEVGVGVHGEAGVEKRKVGTARDTVSMILDKVIINVVGLL